MSFYSNVIFPWGVEKIMNRDVFNEQRASLLSQAQGKILEIGFGTGLNLPYYPKYIKSITTVDINPGMNRYAQKRIAQTELKVDLKILDGAHLPMENNSFDTLVSTWTLCSIKELNAALGELFRVLKPGGKFLFIEHGLSNEPHIQRWQHCLNPLQKCFGDGCHINRNICWLIQQNQFNIVENNQFYLKNLPKIHGYSYRGMAIK